MGIKMCVSTAALAAVAVLAGCGTTVVDNSDSDDPTAQLSEAELTGGEGRELAESDTSPLNHRRHRRPWRTDHHDSP